MPGADENERVKRLYLKALMGSTAFRDLIRDMVDAPPSPFRSIIDQMPPAPKPAYDQGLLDNFKPRKPAWPRVKTLVDKAVELFQKTPITASPKRQPQGTSLLFGYADDSRPIRGLRSDLIVLDEVQDLMDDFSLIERPISPIFQDRSQWGESPLLGAFKDMQDSTLYRQEIMGMWPKEEPPLTSKPLFRREDLMRAYERGLISQKTLMERLEISIEEPEPRVQMPRVAPEEIKSEEFTKRKFQLMGYQSDLNKILGDVTNEIAQAEDAAFLALMTRATQAPPPKPVLAPLVNPDYGDAYRFVDARANQVRIVGWISMNRLSVRTRVKRNEKPELGRGSTQPRKRRCGRDRGAMGYGAYSAVMIPEHVEDRRCPNCRDFVKMSQDMDRPGGQRVLCGECFRLWKTDRTAYEARTVRTAPTPTKPQGSPLFLNLPSPNLP